MTANSLGHSLQELWYHRHTDVAPAFIKGSSLGPQSGEFKRESPSVIPGSRDSPRAQVLSTSVPRAPQQGGQSGVKQEPRWAERQCLGYFFKIRFFYSPVAVGIFHCPCSHCCYPLFAGGESRRREMKCLPPGHTWVGQSRRGR